MSVKITKKRAKTLIHETPEMNRLEGHHFVNEDLYNQIAKKAHELYEQRGCVPGHDIEDWLEAERILKACGTK